MLFEQAYVSSLASNRQVMDMGNLLICAHVLLEGQWRDLQAKFSTSFLFQTSTNPRQSARRDRPCLFVEQDVSPQARGSLNRLAEDD